MDDGLAEELFNAFWDPLVARGWPLPSTWRELHETQMLREANAAWQRRHAEGKS